MSCPGFFRFLGFSSIFGETPGAVGGIVNGGRRNRGRGRGIVEEYLFNWQWRT